MDAQPRNDRAGDRWRRFSLADLCLFTISVSVMLAAFANVDDSGVMRDYFELTLFIALHGVSLAAWPILGRHALLGRDWRNISHWEWAWGVPGLVLLAGCQMSLVVGPEIVALAFIPCYTMGSAGVAALWSLPPTISNLPPACAWTDRIGILVTTTLAVMFLVLGFVILAVLL